MRNGESLTPSGRRPEHIEREIEHTRARMESTLSSLEAKLAPGQMLDRALGFVKNNDVAKRTGKAVGRGAFKQAKHNPIAFALMGSGIAWWIFGGKKKGEQRRAEVVYEQPAYGVEVDLEQQTVISHPVDTTYTTSTRENEQEGAKERIAGKAAETKERIADKAEHAKERAKDKASDLRGKMSEATSRASSNVRSAASSARTKAGNVASSAKSRARDMGRSMRAGYGKAASSGRSAARKAREQASRAGSELSSQAREHPLVFAGLAFAVTAAIGALLRPTRREDRLLGPRRDQVMDRADELAARGVEKAREAADRAFETAHEKVRSGEELEGESMEVHEGDSVPVPDRSGTSAQGGFGSEELRRE